VVQGNAIWDHRPFDGIDKESAIRLARRSQQRRNARRRPGRASARGRDGSQRPEALAKHRNKGKQKITIEHVHVYQGGQAAFIANGTPGEGVGKIGKGHATNRWILCGATFAMQSYSRIMRGPDCFEAAKGSRGSDPRLLRPNNGPATRPHIWGATPCIKDRPCPRVRPTLNYIIPSLNKTAN